MVTFLANKFVQPEHQKFYSEKDEKAFAEIS